MTGIVVFGYKRDLTRCLEAIKTNLPIHVFIDGGGIVHKDATTRKTHLGLATSILEGITQLFDLYDSLIIIEDDVIVSDDFIDYMVKGLEYYKDKKDIGSITGYTSIENKTIYASGRGSSWGWGTWKNRWDAFDPNISGSLKGFDDWGEDLPAMLVKAQRGIIDSWAVKWCYYNYVNNLKCIFPPKSKVKNIGLTDGTNCRSKQGLRYETELHTGDVEFFHPIFYSEEIRFRFRAKFKQSIIRKIINLRYR